MWNNPGAPGPAGQLAFIITYGAVADNSSVDNTAAIQNCFNACQSQGKIAWIPKALLY